MKHMSYQLNLEYIYKMLVEAGIVKKATKKNRNLKTLAKTMRLTYDRNPEMTQTLECVIHCEEYYWLMTGCHTYFFEDEKIADAISRGSHRITDVESLYQGSESFMLMIPDGTKFGSLDAAGGLLVTIFQHGNRDKELIGEFFKAMGYPQPSIQTRTDMGKFTLCISYQQGTRKYEYCRVAMPSHQLKHVLEMDNYIDYAAHMDATNTFDYFKGMDLNVAEEEYQYGLVRLVAGLLMYRKALPDRIVAGMPSNNTGQIHSKFSKQKIMKNIRHPKNDAGMKAGHYRSWYLRQLSHDKYYKGEYANMEKGSRIIFVQDSFVGREIEAETAI